MPFHEELLQQSLDLANKDLEKPTQADLRRAVSSAYYALFHLLIYEAVSHWNLDSSRHALGRMFEHSSMKRASDRVADAKASPYKSEDVEVVRKLRFVAQAFVQLQDMRKTADYDNSKVWRHNEAILEIRTASNAFSDWQSIRQEKIAQDYLVSLLIKSRD